MHSGWVRANGRTIGSVTSGGTERANADSEALFLYLWAADASLSVSGGRGANAADDWGKQEIALLTGGEGNRRLDGMGNTREPAQLNLLRRITDTLGAPGARRTKLFEIPICRASM